MIKFQKTKFSFDIVVEKKKIKKVLYFMQFCHKDAGFKKVELVVDTE